MQMKAMLVSVNYSDYLEYILPYNTLIFDEIVVITTKTDIDCQRVCKKYTNVTCIVVEDKLLKHNNAVFNKGKLLNEGMYYLRDQKYNGYLCLTDSDIIFNNYIKKFKQHIKKLNARKINTQEILIGMPRYIIEKQEDFVTWQNNTTKKYDFLKRLPLGKEKRLLGYAQIFYFKFDQDVWLQDENCVNAQIVDAKFIGKFKTVAKKSTNWRHRITQDSPEYIFEYLKYHGKQGKEYGVHIEDAETFCIHIGETWLNRSGRVTDKWISNSV